MNESEDRTLREMGRSGSIDLEAVKEKLQGTHGPEMWRSLDELAGTPDFQDWLHREFPRQASEWVEPADDGVSRRAFLQLAGASLGLAGLTGCTKQPLERIVPYVRQPEEVVPGRALYFATTHVHGGYGYGVLAESHTGRPTKIEGNPEHPASLGATDVFAQASVLGLYDPNRSQSIVNLGRIRTWGAFVNEASPLLKAQQALGGEGVRILTGTVTSPTFADQMKTILAQYPKARWHRFEPAAAHDEYAATAAAFGGPHDRIYDLTKAKVILALDSDFLTQGPGSLRYSRDFSRARQVRAKRQTMNRLYAIESLPTNTGTLADHRLPLSPDEVAAFALALAAGLGAAAADPASPLSPRAQQLVAAAVKDLEANQGACLVVADGYAPQAVQMLAFAMNQHLGNVGKTVRYTKPVEADPVDPLRSIEELVIDLNAGKVEALFVLGANPVYTAPADLGFADAYQKARLRVHHGLYQDETAQLSHWHIPESHPLETWSDARAYDGTVSLVQPLIEPLYESKSGHELLALFANQIDASAYDVVHAYWLKNLPPAARAGNAADPEAAFRKVLHDGVVPGTAEPEATVAINFGAVQQAAATIAGKKIDPQAITLLFRPDPTIWDGRYAGNPWLQELPKPMTKLVWDNALVIGPALSRRLKLQIEDVVEVSAGGRKIQAAVWVQPGHADRCATLHLGYGRWNAGPVGNEHGFNAYALRTTAALWAVPGIGLKKTGQTFTLASTQNHHLLESGAEEIPEATDAAAVRHPVRTGTLADFQDDQNLIHKKPGEPTPEEEQEEKEEANLTLYPPYEYKGYAWGMAIDLNVCTGCSACVVACQAENNIPTVGKDQVLKQRAMHWLRIDRYFAGDLDDPQVHHQPVPCMQCENAPCELVCPVAATTHSSEGLNDMVYNRCVGTRYCSNNCPYKVRRFNFLRYSNHDVPVLKLLQNPDVTVRMRGVMEKCTYCVQRINRAKIDTEVASRTVVPGDIQTACQQACPTEAIVFGDNNNPAWESTERKADPLNYALLEELNTRPRTTYLAKLQNPNPEMGDKEKPGGLRI